MVIRMILVKTIKMIRAQQDYLGPDRIDSVPGHHSFVSPSYEVDSIYVLLLILQSASKNATGFACDNRDSILRSQKGPGSDCVLKLLVVLHPIHPQILVALP